MTASKRPSTSSLRRFITTRPYVTVAELRRRFLLDDPDAVCCVRRNGTSAFVGLPEREAAKLQDLWERDEIGLELSVEVRAPVVVGIYPMHIARFIQDGHTNGYASAPAPNGHANGYANGHANGVANGDANAHADPHLNGHPGGELSGAVPRPLPPPSAG